MAAYAQTPSPLMCLPANGLINGLYKQISCKTHLYADNLYISYAICIQKRSYMYKLAGYIAS